MAIQVLERRHRVGIYARISSDPSKDRLGIDRQIELCQDLCLQRGWQVIDLYPDDHKSAWKENVKREQYDRMMADLQAGRIDTLVAWHPDRLHRGKGLDMFIDAVNAVHADIATVQGGDYDLATASGKMVARVVGAVARHESEHKSERILAKVVQLQKAGKYTHGWRRRPFGYRWVLNSEPDTDGKVKGHLEIDPVEADVIRELAGRYLAGEGVMALARDLERRGILTVSGGTGWRHTTVRGMLTNPFIAGMRRVSGSGRLEEAPWPAIIDLETHHELVAKSRQQAQSGRRAPRRYLLTGVTVCGSCGARMYATTSHAGPRYFCDRTKGGCGRVSILAGKTEQVVAGLVVRTIDAKDFGKRLARAQGRPGGMEEERRRLEERLGVLADMLGAGELDRAGHNRARAKVQIQLDALREHDQEHASYGPLDRYARGGLGADWDGLELDQQRAIVGALLDRIVINPQGEDKTPRFDAARIVIPADAWRV